MAPKGTAENLAMLVSLQMLGFIVLEVVAWLLVAAGVLPPVLTLKNMGTLILQVNTAYIVIAGLLSVLVAGFWLALLTEAFGIVEIKEIKVKL